MKKVAGTLKLDQAQFRELEAFAKFGSDLDAATTNIIEKGRRNVEILKQPEFSPLRVEQQIAIIYLGTKGLLMDVPTEKISEFESLLLTTLEKKAPEVLTTFASGKLEQSAIDTLVKIGGDLAAQFK